MTDKNTSIGLAEMIDSLRQELLFSQKKSEDSKLIFDVEKIDLELQVTIEKVEEANGNLGVKFWVLDAEMGGKGSDKKSTTQTIKLSLNAKDLSDIDNEGNPRKARVRG